MNRTFLMLSLVVLLAQGCATTTVDYIEERKGYSVTTGRITEVESLHCHNLERLGNGLAMTVSEPGGRVALQFDEKSRKVFSLEPGMILVFGQDQDHVLQPEMQAPRGQQWR